MFKKIKGLCHQGLLHLAAGLQATTDRMSTRTLLLVTFLFFIGGASVLTTVIAFTWRGSGASLVVTSIRVPAFVLPPEPARPDSLRDQAFQRHIQAVTHYLDSLRDSPAGKVRYDSLTRLRPHLLDSLHQLENLFLHPLTITP
jgi:hypothetical protein